MRAWGGMGKGTIDLTGVMKMFSNWLTVMAAQLVKCTRNHSTVHLKCVNFNKIIKKSTIITTSQ